MPRTSHELLWELGELPILENFYGSSVDVESVAEQLAVDLDSSPGVMDELREEESLSAVLFCSIPHCSHSLLFQGPQQALDRKNLLTTAVPCHGSEASLCGS